MFSLIPKDVSKYIIFPMIRLQKLENLLLLLADDLLRKSSHLIPKRLRLNPFVFRDDYKKVDHIFYEKRVRVDLPKILISFCDNDSFHILKFRYKNNRGENVYNIMNFNEVSTTDFYFETVYFLSSESILIVEKMNKIYERINLLIESACL